MTTTHPANFLRELNASLAAIRTTPATDSEILMIARRRIRRILRRAAQAGDAAAGAYVKMAAVLIELLKAAGRKMP